MSSGIGTLSAVPFENWRSYNDIPTLSLNTQGIILAWWSALEEMLNLIPFDPISTIPHRFLDTTSVSISLSDSCDMACISSTPGRLSCQVENDDLPKLLSCVILTTWLPMTIDGR